MTNIINNKPILRYIKSGFTLTKSASLYLLK